MTGKDRKRSVRKIEAGSTEPRVALTQQTSVRDFRDFYWLKSELQEFCRSHGLSTSGGKRDIADRIEVFLQTGKVIQPQASEQKQRVFAEIDEQSTGVLSMATRAPAGFKCSQAVRRFFETEVSPQFRFTVTLQQYIREHPGITFAEIAEQWKREHAARKAGILRPAIAPQFEFNQFTRDFHADPQNAGKTRQDCLEAWKRTRAGRGEKKYRPGSR